VYQQVWTALSSIDFADKTFQYRKDVGPDDVKDLAESIKNKGQDIPIVLRRMPDGRLQIICGFRRYTAELLIGWVSIKAIIVPFENMSDAEARLLSARENMQRAQYSALDKIFMVKKLSDQGVSNVEIGGIIGKSEMQVRRYLKIANAPAEVHEQIQAGKISASEAGESVSRPNVEQIVDNTKYNVKSVRNMLKAKFSIAINEQNEATIDAFLVEVKKTWRNALKQASKKANKQQVKQPEPSDESQADFQGQTQ
jgi:ParB/RepB/Spo0J family partition protein